MFLCYLYSLKWPRNQNSAWVNLWAQLYIKTLSTFRLGTGITLAQFCIWKYLERSHDCELQSFQWVYLATSKQYLHATAAFAPIYLIYVIIIVLATVHLLWINDSFCLLQLSVLTGVRYLQTAMENVLILGDPESESHGWLLENSCMETAKQNIKIIKNLGKFNQISTLSGKSDPNVDIPIADYGPDNVPPGSIPTVSWPQYVWWKLFIFCTATAIFMKL